MLPGASPHLHPQSQGCITTMGPQPDTGRGACENGAEEPAGQVYSRATWQNWDKGSRGHLGWTPKRGASLVTPSQARGSSRKLGGSLAWRGGRWSPAQFTEAPGMQQAGTLVKSFNVVLKYISYDSLT